MKTCIVIVDSDGEELVVSPFENATEADAWASERLADGRIIAGNKYYVTPITSPDEYDASPPDPILQASTEG